jgi:hypothetical protein
VVEGRAGGYYTARTPRQPHRRQRLFDDEDTPNDETFMAFITITESAARGRFFNQTNLGASNLL